MIQFQKWFHMVSLEFETIAVDNETAVKIDTSFYMIRSSPNTVV